MNGEVQREEDEQKQLRREAEEERTGEREPKPYPDTLVVKRSGFGYTLIADGIHRGHLSLDALAKLLGDPPPIWMVKGQPVEAGQETPTFGPFDSQDEATEFARAYPSRFIYEARENPRG